MKRALAVCMVLAVLGFAGFAQISVTGKWTGSLCLLPSTDLTSDLGLTFKVNGFDITSNTGFGAKGISYQKFGLKGALGPFSLTGDMWFAVSVPEYMASRLVTSFDLAGLSLGLKILHWDTDYNANMFTSTTDWPYRPFYEYPYLTTSPCTQAGGFGMLYILTAKVDPVSIRASFVDCCTGIEFNDLYVSLSGLGLCCGITYDVELHFVKEKGFDYLSVSGINIPLCCGVSLDVAVTYEVDAKSIEITPKFGGIAEACFTVWGNATGDFTVPGVTWNGIEIYGYKISCKIADCNAIEFVNAFNVSEVNKKLPSADRFKTSITCGQDGQTVNLGEFELIKLTFCGPGCCGGTYSVGLRIFFGSGGGIFDITRFVYTASIPIMANFTFDISGTMYAVTAAGSCSSLCIGWTFTF